MHVQTMADCYDWETVTVNGMEEAHVIENCVGGSFENFNSFASDNRILRADREWANAV